ncbi:low temperature-induced protein [Aureibacillus halotolerans]|uniref:Heat induced stress protein YflT n=1 Tax=Aureibacillus halotolerans TaxID=1508390 RepID=A0A4R6U2N1_9BACI|nr:low temperature-induced protein [Aureibacillus halotolerans]TDQ37374.1 hypothetical protein EV213_1138 [Aureibacillus halotolerans]
MASYPYAVAGLFNTRAAAIDIIEYLKAHSYSEDHISVVAGKEEDAEAIEEKTEAEDALEPYEKNASKGLGVGVSSGMVTGGLAALVAELAAFTLPGVGPLIAAGPLISTLTGAIVGAGAGGLIGGLIAYGVPKERANHYKHQVKEGDVLVVIEATTEEESNNLLEWFAQHDAKDAHIYVKEEKR